MAINLNVEGAKRGNFFKIPLSQVKVREENNTRFAPPSRDELDGLKESIREHGQMVPVEVIVQPDRTVLLEAGHQRYSVLRELYEETGDEQFSMVKCIPFQGNEEEAILRGIEENLRRANPTPMDNAKNFRTLIERLHKTPEEVAKIYRCSSAKVTEGLKLLGLPYDIQMQIHQGAVPQDSGIFLASKVVPEMRGAVLEEAIRIAAERIVKDAPVTPDEPVTPEPTVEPTDTDAPATAPTADAAAPAPAAATSTSTAAAAPAPAPVKPKGKKGAAAPAAAPAPIAPTKNTKRVTGTDIKKAARNLAGAIPEGQNPPLKMKEFKDYLEEVVETEPTDSPKRELSKALLQFISGKLTQVQMDNRMDKFCGLEPSKAINTPKGGRK